MENSRFKFRAWNTADKVMIYDLNTPKILHGRLVYDYDDVLMQYTGLKDMNGLDIYEGDIVMCKVTTHVHDDEKEFSYYNTYDDGSRTKHCCKPKPCVVSIGDGGVSYTHKTGASCTAWLTKSTEVKVIGSIHENPELLESKND